MNPDSLQDTTIDNQDSSTCEVTDVTSLKQERRIGVAIRHITNEFIEDVATQFPKTSIVLGHEFVEFDTTGCEDPDGVMRYVVGKTSELFSPEQSTRSNDEIFLRSQKGISFLTPEERGSENPNEFVFTVDGRHTPEVTRHLQRNLELSVVCKLIDSHKTQITLFGKSLNLYVLVHCLQDYDYHTDNPVLNIAAKSMKENQPFGNEKQQARFTKNLRRQRIGRGMSMIHN